MALKAVKTHFYYRVLPPTWNKSSDFRTVTAHLTHCNHLLCRIMRFVTTPEQKINVNSASHGAPSWRWDHCCNSVHLRNDGHVHLSRDSAFSKMELEVCQIFALRRFRKPIKHYHVPACSPNLRNAVFQSVVESFAARIHGYDVVVP